MHAHIEKCITSTYGHIHNHVQKRDVVRTNTDNDTGTHILRWNSDDFPLSTLLERVNDGKLPENTLYKQFDSLTSMTAKEMGRALHSLDIRLYQRVLPTEIVEYGSTTCNGATGSLADIIKKNKALTSLVGTLIAHGHCTTAFFLRVCQYLRHKRSHNSIVAILNGIRMHRTVTFALPEQDMSGKTVPPFERILADVALSNVAVTDRLPQAEEACMLFSEVVHFFVRLQDVHNRVDVDSEHVVMREMVRARNVRVNERVDVTDVYDGSYLFI